MEQEPDAMRQSVRQVADIQCCSQHSGLFVRNVNGHVLRGLLVEEPASALVMSLLIYSYESSVSAQVILDEAAVGRLEAMCGAFRALNQTISRDSKEQP